jgi:ribosomal protein S18 acetylase RimI-like enzyme
MKIEILCPELEPALVDFFITLRKEGADKYFHPHPLTPDEARQRCSYVGRDIYCVLTKKQKIIGYAMLRGWDAGFDTPSLGIALRQSAQGRGFADFLMKFLHATAREQGAKKIILKVHKDNLHARRLYERLGYTFIRNVTGEQLAGSISL